jgi:hypothetical protein
MAAPKQADVYFFEEKSHIVSPQSLAKIFNLPLSHLNKCAAAAAPR